MPNLRRAFFSRGGVQSVIFDGFAHRLGAWTWVRYAHVSERSSLAARALAEALGGHQALAIELPKAAARRSARAVGPFDVV